MNSSRFRASAERIQSATVNSKQIFAVKQPQLPFDGPMVPAPGSLNDSEIVRAAIVQAIKKCGKSRAQIAEQVSFYAGRTLTEITLNKFTAESRNDYRWPAELDRAFCFVTGDDTLLRCRAESAGYRLIKDNEIQLLELGRQYLRRKRANEEAEMLERQLAGVEL